MSVKADWYLPDRQPARCQGQGDPHGLPLLGGRRRSEVAGLRKELLVMEAPIPVEGSAPLPSLSIHLGRTKTSGADADEIGLPHWPAHRCAGCWLKLARIDSGSVFRAIDRWGNVSQRALDPKAIKRHRQTARRHGWPQSGGVFRPRPALRLSHRSSQPRHPSPRGNGTVRAIDPSSRRRNTTTTRLGRSGRAARLMD